MNEPSFYRVSIKALVRDPEGRVLICRESDGRWDLLGGGLDHGEDPIEGLRRELQEEAGLSAASIAHHPSYFLTVYNAERQVYLANVFYEVVLEDLVFTPSEECQELRFVSPDDITGLDVKSNIKQLLALIDNN